MLPFWIILFEDFWTSPFIVVFWVFGIVGIYRSLLALPICNIYKPLGFWIPLLRISIGRRFLMLVYWGMPFLFSILSWEPEPPLPAPIAIGIVWFIHYWCWMAELFLILLPVVYYWPALRRTDEVLRAVWLWAFLISIFSWMFSSKFAPPTCVRYCSC